MLLLIIKIVNTLRNKFCIVTRIYEEAHSQDFYKEILIEPLSDLLMRSETELKNFKEFDLNAIKKYREKQEAIFTNADYLEYM